MDTVIAVFKHANAVAFGVLAVLCVQQWRLRRGASTPWAVAAFGSLATIALIGLVLPKPVSTTGFSLWTIKGLLVVLILFPYFLYRFAAAFDRPNRIVEAVATVGTLAVVVWSLAIPRLFGPQEPRPAWVAGYIVTVLTQWTVLFSVVAWRLWSAGKGQATVPRRRMRTLALGSVGLNLAVLVSSMTRAAEPSPMLLASQMLSSASAFLFFLGFAPPPLLLFVWRRREQAALAGLMGDLIGATSPDQVSGVLLPATRIVGALGAAFVSPAGDVIATLGSAASPEECARILAESSQDGNHDRGPLVLGLRSGTMIVWSSPYAPFFGSEELNIMKELGSLADIAMERCGLIEQQRSFIANAAHELRTPLTSILGLSLTLGRQGERISAKEREECVEALERQGERARTLINNLLDLAQLDSGRLLMSIEPVPLALAAERALAAASPPDGTSVEVLIDDGIQAAADAERLEQILVNLLVNAYRYGRGPVRIRAHGDGDDVVLAVSDAGPGVPAELTSHLFDPFTRAPSSPQKGSGLGLSISRRLAEAFGGTISYAPGSPTGACFNVRLRRAA